MFPRHISALALRCSFWIVLACALGTSLLAWQGASAEIAQQDQAASFTFSETQGACTPVTGFGAHFPPGSTVIIAGPQVNGRNVGDFTQIEKQATADGTFTVTIQPCPKQLVSAAGTFPLSDGLQFTFTADTRAQNGVGSAATYTVSGLANSRLPSTGASAVDIPGLLAVQPLYQPLLAVGLLAGTLAALGGCLLMFERGRHRLP